MEEALYSIVNLKSMEVIDIKTGSKLGFIKDLKIDCEDYRILSILIPNQRVSWFSRNDNIEIPWTNVVKVGLDVILIDSEGLNLNDKV